MYVEEKEEEEARKLFEMATKADKKSLFAHLNLIKIYRSRKDYDHMIKNSIPLINKDAGWQTQVVHELCQVDKSVLTGEMLMLLQKRDEEIQRLQCENGNLQREVLDLKYQPGGIGYHEAKKHFESLYD